MPSGRVPDSKMDKYEKYVKDQYSCPKDLHDRLLKFCADEERTKSWTIQKALDAYLKKQGY